MEKQEYKIVDSNNHLHYCFFVSRPFKTARQDMTEYIERNKTKINMHIFQLSNKPKPFPKWELIATSNVK